MMCCRDESLIVLGIALEAQEIVIAAVGDARILAADGGPRLVDRAAPRLDIEELADYDVIFVVFG
jgi:hypothetical protein